MENTALDEERTEGGKSWFIIFGLAIAVVCWGFLIYFTVGDKGPPPWDYSIIPDVPGQSIYSTYGAKQFSGEVPKPLSKDEVVKQHVMEPAEKSEAFQVLGNGGQ